MKLFRYDYELDSDGYSSERVVKDQIYGWCAVNTDTGEVDLEDFRQFDDELEELTNGWEWKKFNLTLSEDP